MADVFYSAYHLHVPRDVPLQESLTATFGTAAVVSPSNSEIGNNVGLVTTRISKNDLRKELRDIFDVDEEMMTQIVKEVVAREVSLHSYLFAGNFEPEE